MPSIIQTQATTVASHEAADADIPTIPSAADRLKRMEEIIREVNEKLAPEFRALQQLRQPNAKQLAKRYY